MLQRREADTMRNPITAIVAAAAVAAAAMAQPMPAQAECWGCWVVPGTSHAYMYGSIYGPQFAYPPYSEYGYAPYGYYGYAPASDHAAPHGTVHGTVYGAVHGPYLFVHHTHHHA